MRKIPTSAPVIGRQEIESALASLEAAEISGLSGTRISEFESLFSNYCGASYGVAVSSGTSALHLAVNALNLNPNDEVLVASLTNMATFFAVLYQGAKPVPIDVEPETGNLDPTLLELSLTDRTVGVIVVHLFGHPVDMEPVIAFCEAHGLWLIEDAAEAHGAEYNGTKVGTFGNVSCFSFFANKIITTGEGGMLVTNQEKLANHAKQFRSLAFGSVDRFQHAGLGFNYRMTNLQAAVGVAQMTRIDENIRLKRDIASRYSANLTGMEGLRLPIERSNVKSVYWMYHVVLENEWEGQRERVRAFLRDEGIETRESFTPYDQQDFFIDSGAVRRGVCPIAGRIGANGFYIPSGPQLDHDEIDFVSDRIRVALDAH